MNFIESLNNLDIPRPFMEACSSAYTAIFETQTKMEKAIEKACEIAGVKDEGDLSDGNHTFNDLYWQRCILFAALVNLFPKLSWKTKRHDDGELCHGGKNFLVCIETPKGPYSYHYPMKHWGLFKCKEIEKAEKFDGHTDKDVERLLSLLPENLPRSVLGEIWNKRGDCNMKNYQKPAPLVESQYNTYKIFPRNQVRATYSGHALHLSDGTVVDGFPIGIRGTVEVIVDGAEKGNFEYKPFRWPGDPEEPEPIYYQYKITSHIPEDSSNKPANHVHFTNCPEAEKLVKWVSFSKGVPMMESFTQATNELGKFLKSDENDSDLHLLEDSKRIVKNEWIVHWTHYDRVILTVSPGAQCPPWTRIPGKDCTTESSRKRIPTDSTASGIYWKT